MLSLAFCLFCIVPQPSPVRTEVADIAHVNHFYDEKGDLIFTQVIWLEWDRVACRDQVCGWRLAKVPSIIPMHGVSWFCEDGIVMKVVSRHQTESWTQEDPELLEREHLPAAERRPFLLK